MTLTTEQIAFICHEANRAYCLALHDDSQPAWQDAPEWQRASAIAGVQTRLANPGADPRTNHEAWLKHKAEQGWKYGPAKDPDKKEHPCFLPYDELPADQQVKDALFGSIVDALASSHVMGSMVDDDDDFNEPLGVRSCNLDGDECESCQ